jgi:hypothetical protein
MLHLWYYYRASVTANIGVTISLEKSANVDRFSQTLMRWRYEVFKTNVFFFWGITSSPIQEIVSNWRILTSQSHYAIGITQSHNDSWEQSCSHRWNSDPHMWKQLSSRTEGLAIPFRRQHSCQKKKFTSSENQRLASCGDYVPFSISQTECKTRHLSSFQIWGTSHNSPINVSP